MKQTIKLNKETLKKMIAESMKKIINENTWRGVPGTRLIWHGEWSDPEIAYKGELINSNDAEESLWISYKEECEEMGEKPTEQGFEVWIKEQKPDYLASKLDDLVLSAKQLSENKQYKTNTNMKQTIKLDKETLKKMIAESVKNILSEDTKAQRKKDPMNRWFNDMENIQKHRDNMEYITKGGKKPKHWKNNKQKEDLNENESFDLEYDDNGYITNLPEDIEEWGRKCQQLGYELSLLKGKYRFINDELYDMLNTIDQQLNGANADLNTFSIAKHWSL